MQVIGTLRGISDPAREKICVVLGRRKIDPFSLTRTSLLAVLHAPVLPVVILAIKNPGSLEE
jgi:hypothetical protein